MVMVLMSAWIPAPPELSEPAMARMRGGRAHPAVAPLG
jgi:hypothetical protein